MHFAGEDRIYLIFRNKFTQEWEFPTTKIFFGQSFLRAKQNLFQSFSDGVWKIKYYQQQPLVATLREFTEVEKQDKLNKGMKGVRTFFFQAHHWRGLPQMDLQNTEFDDHAWVPKRLLNEYFTEDYHAIFAKACLTR